MVGRRQRQKQQREARILRAAELLFARRGFADTGMQDIATRARLAVGTLYNYFASKPEILLAIVERDTAEGLSAGEEVLKHPPRDPVVAVQVLLERAVSPYGRHDRALWRELLGAAMADPTLGRGVFAADVRLIGLLASLLRELSSRGDLRRDFDPGRAAITLYGAFFVWFMAYIANEAVELSDIRAEMEKSVDLIMKGFLERAPTQKGRRP